MRTIKTLFTSFALLALAAVHSYAQTAPVKFFSQASTNATLVFPSKAFLGGGIVSNTTATVYYLKFYNKATAPTCGTDIPVWTIMLAASSSTQIPAIASELNFGNGLGFCITANFADTDTTAAATGVIVNLGISGR